MADSSPQPEPSQDIPPIIGSTEQSLSEMVQAAEVDAAPENDSLGRLLARVVGSFVLAIVLGAVLTTPIFLIAAKTHGRMPTAERVLAQPQYFVFIALGTAAGFLGVGLWRIRVASEARRPLPALFPPGLRRPLKLGVVYGLALFAVNSVYTTIIVRILSERSSPWSTASAEGSFLARVFVFLIGVVAAPCAEEVFFRGYVFGEFKRAQRVRGGVIVSSVLFALAHLPDVSAIPFLCVLGALAAVLYHRTGSLAASIACHAVNNLLAIGFAMVLR